jgi:serine/threonine kinase 16
VSQALKEVEAYTLFSPNANIITSIDYAVQNDSGSKISGIGDTGAAGAKTVYIILPYYRRGNLQDAINANLVNHTQFPEKKLMTLMLGVCNALKSMHQYRIRSTNPTAQARKQAKQVRSEAEAEDADAERRKARTKNRTMTAERQDDINEEQEQPLMDNEVTRSQEGMAPGDIRAYAHRDIKPGNIMIDDDGRSPILMDFGSLAPSPTPITSRSLALAVQDLAAEHSTMPYRAPELFDVKTDSVIDTKVDIWSLGCTMYACLIGKSPFEARSDETGGSLSMCVLGGDWKWPGEDKGKGKARQGTPISQVNGVAEPETYPSESVREVVKRCLALEPSERPDVDELMEILEQCIKDLPEDSTDDI